MPVVSDGVLPKSLMFLPGVKHALRYGDDPLPEFDLICMLDCSDRRRLAAFTAMIPAASKGDYPIVNIDHHVTNDIYGVVNIVVPKPQPPLRSWPSCSSTGVFDSPRTIAQCLLAGIYGDTLGLRTDSTRPRTMRTSADLVDAGANPATITDALFRLKPKSSVCLWEHALRRVAVGRPVDLDRGRPGDLVDMQAPMPPKPRALSISCQVPRGPARRPCSIRTTLDIASACAAFPTMSTWRLSPRHLVAAAIRGQQDARLLVVLQSETSS